MRARTLLPPPASPMSRLAVLLGLSLGAGFGLGALSLGGRGSGELLALAALFTLAASAVAVTGAAQQVLAMLVMVLTGAVWTFQGLGYLEGSPMTDQSIWAVLGPLVAGLGVALVIVAARRRE